MSTYILLKDLPDLKAGAEFIFNGDHWIHLVEGVTAYKFTEGVITNPEWFEQNMGKVWTNSDMVEFAYTIGQCDKEQVKRELNHFIDLQNKKAKP